MIKKIFLLLFMFSIMFFSINIFGITITVNPDLPTYSFKDEGILASFTIQEDAPEEFSNLTMTIHFQNAYLLCNLDKFNVTSDSLFFNGDYTIEHGKFGDNFVTIHFGNNSETLNSISLSNIYVKITNSSNFNFVKASILLSTETDYHYVNLAKIEEKSEYKYFYYAQKLNWWTGLCVINDSNEDIIEKIYFYPETGNNFEYDVTIPALNYYIIGFWDIGDINETTGYFKIKVNSHLHSYVLISDGDQSFTLF